MSHVETSEKVGLISRSEKAMQAVRLAAEGKVETTVDRTLPLERWAEALDAVRDGEAVGRVVLRP